MLMDIAPADQGRRSLFDGIDESVPSDRPQLMQVLDAINRTMGRDTLWLAGQGLTQRERADSWRMNRKNLSPAYTTQWSDLPVVHAG